MANQSARELLSRLPVSMANGGDPALYADSQWAADIESEAMRRARETGTVDQYYANLLATEQRILDELAEDPSSWGPEKAYNAIIESGVSIKDALNAGVKQSTIDAIFASGAPLTAAQLGGTTGSAFAGEGRLAGVDRDVYAGQAQQILADFMADDYISPEERRYAQQVATTQGLSLADIASVGIDPNILFNIPEPEPAPVPVVPVTPEQPTVSAEQFPQTQAEYVPPTVYQPLPDNTSVFAPGEPSLDVAFRESAPRTEVTEDVMGTQQLTGFDYAPAASLISATGSGFSWTPPTVTSRPRSLLSTEDLRRYNQGRAAQDLRQLVGGNEEAYRAFEPLLSQTGSYGGGLSRSQLFALMQQQANQQAQQDAANYQQFGTRFGARPAGTTGYAEIAENVPMYAEDMRGVNVSTGSLNDPMTVKPVDFRYGRPYAEGGEVKKPEGSEELTAEGDTESAGMLANLFRGVKEIPSSIYGYGERLIESPVGATTQLGLDALSMGKAVKESVGDDPIGFLLDMAPVIGEIRSGMDVDKYSDLADEARAAGDTESARMYEQIVALSAAGAVPLAGMGARAAKRTAKAGIEAAETAATQSARMLDEIAPTTAQAPEARAPTVYPSEQLRADPVVANDPIAVRFNEQIAADPQAAIEQYKLIPKTKGGKILNADLVRELSPDYLKDRSLAKNIHEPASELNKVMYQQRLADDMGQEGVWVFTGGGAASGKSAGLTDAAEDAADLVMDGTLADFDKSVGLIDAAADSGKAVEIIYIDRDPQKAIVQMLNRAIEEGRPVPLDVFLDGHRGARQSIKRLTEKYADDPRVNIEIWNNQGAKGEQFQTTIDNLSEMDYDTALKESLEVVDEYYKTGKIDQKLYDAITGDIQSRNRSASEAVPSSRGAGNTQSGSLQDAQKQLGITEQSQAQWRATHSGVRQTRVPEVQEAAKQLREGKISTEQYQEIVREFQPIKPLAAVQQMPTLEDIAMALTKNPEKSAGIVGVNVDIPDGTPVASRLDIPAYESYDTWVVSLHDGTKSGGEAIGYGQAAVLNNVEFKSSAKGGLNIAAGEMPSGKPASKSTIARVYGSWENRSPEDVRAMAEEIIRTNDPDWVEVGMNPFRHSYFYQKTDGMPVKSAEQVIQVGPLVLAKKPQTIPVESPEHLVKTPQGDRYFKHGGSVERVHNDNRKYL